MGERQVLGGLTAKQLLTVHQACGETDGLCRGLRSPRDVVLQAVQFGMVVAKGDGDELCSCC